jgi:hypothetical protein
VTGNAASIYWAEQKNAPQLREVIDHALWPQGPAGGRLLGHQPGGLQDLQVQKEAKAFIQWMMCRAVPAWMGIGEA